MNKEINKNTFPGGIPNTGELKKRLSKQKLKEPNLTPEEWKKAVEKYNYDFQNERSYNLMD